MNWLLEVYRLWWADHGVEFGAPEAPIRAPSRWINDFYWPWFETQPDDTTAPAPPWPKPVKPALESPQ